jgi:hypothetical protein
MSSLFRHIQNFHFLINGKDITVLLDLEALTVPLLLRSGGIITVNNDFLNTNTAITRQLIRTARTLEAEFGKFTVKRGYGDRGRWVNYWARFGCWISPCYVPFSLGAHFSTYEPYISLIFQLFFPNRSKPRILNPRIRGSACIIYKLYWMLFS